MSEHDECVEGDIVVSFGERRHAVVNLLCVTDEPGSAVSHYRLKDEDSLIFVAPREPRCREGLFRELTGLVVLVFAPRHIRR